MSEPQALVVAPTELLAEIRDNVETVITGGPEQQQDATEPRYKLTISGPARLVETLMEIITANPSRLGAAHLVRGTQHGVVLPPNSERE